MNTNSQTLVQTEDLLSKGCKTKEMQAESSKQTAANTTGKKRLRSSSGFQINTEAQSEVPKRQCLDDISQAFSSLEDSFRDVKKPELTSEQH